MMMDAPKWLPKILLSATALGLVAVHTVTAYKLDPVALGVLGIAVLPWLASFLQSAELPGGLKVQFLQIKAEQVRQAGEIDAIKFMLAYFLTDYEPGTLRGWQLISPTS